MSYIVSIVSIRTVQSSHTKIFHEIAIEVKRAGRACIEIDASSHELWVSHCLIGTGQHTEESGKVSEVVGLKRTDRHAHLGAVVREVADCIIVTRVNAILGNRIAIADALSRDHTLVVGFMGKGRAISGGIGGVICASIRVPDAELGYIISPAASTSQDTLSLT